MQHDIDDAVPDVDLIGIIKFSNGRDAGVVKEDVERSVL
jgi:hypothetical protein